MTHPMSMSWIALLGFGAFHGVNPAMGWLFAVALGMQERRRSAVWRALLPLGVGHALAVAAAIVLVIVAGVIVPIEQLRWPVAIILGVFGITRLIRHRHPRWTSMRVGMGRLTLWSFLMASVHGAGLMVVPFFLRMSFAAASDSSPSMPGSAATALLATSLHAAAYLATTALVAVLVFEKLGVAILRKAWLNLDLLWGVALCGSGVITPLV